MERTHRVRLYERAGPDPNPHSATPPPAWTPVGVEVGANLQPLTGSVQQLAAGQQVNATWKGFFPAGVALKEGRALVVLSGPGPRAFLVRQVGEQGAPWDTEAMLDTTEEEIAP